MSAKRPKSVKLTAWDLALLEEALRSYDAPGFDDHGKACRVLLIEKLAASTSGRLNQPYEGV